MTATCVECGSPLLVDEVETAAIVYQCSCTASMGREIALSGEVRGGRVVLRDGRPDEIVTVTV